MNKNTDELRPGVQTRKTMLHSALAGWVRLPATQDRLQQVPLGAACALQVGGRRVSLP